jgi:hypothetical protein
MAVAPNSVVTPQAVQNGSNQFSDANGTVLQTLITAGANGTFIRALTVATDNTANRRFELWINNGSVDRLFGSVTVLALAGSDGIVPIKNVLNSTDFPGLPTDALGNPFFFLKNGWLLKAKCDANMAAGKLLNSWPFAEDL